ncbi:MAG: bifunctional DedA family/phosphatase PAP2 family protein [Pseudomonadota bacterium]
MSIADTLFQMAPSTGLLLLIIAAIALVESLALVGLLVPGVVLMTAATSLAGHQDLSLGPVLIAAFIGAAAGDGLSFLLGYTQRERVTAIWPLSRHPEWLARGARFFQRHGALSVFLGRFVGPVRPVVPLIAGMLRMSPRSFTWANLGSAVIWAPAYVLPGYLLGRTWQQLLDLPEGLKTWLVALGMLVVMLAVTFSWCRHLVTRDGLAYRSLDRLLRQTPTGRRVWRLLAPPHKEEPPLASWLLLILSVATLSAWTLVVIHGEGPLAMDLRLAVLLERLDMPGLASSGQLMGKAGDLLGVLALCLPWAAWLLWRRQRSAFWHITGGLIGIALLNTLLKAVIGRVRPVAPAHLADSFSYPSAHTSTAVVLFGMAAAFATRGLPHGRRFLAYWAAIAVTLPMALSRLLIEVHWLSDLIGGALLGLVVCALVQLSWQRQPRPRLGPCPWHLLGAASLGLVAARIAWLPMI